MNSDINSPTSDTRLDYTRRRRRRQAIVFSVLGVVVVLAVIAVVIGVRQDRASAPAGSGIRVTTGDIVNSITATGSIVAETGAQVNVGSQVGGTIKRIFVDEGARVKAGQIVAQVDMPDIEAQYKQAVAALGADRNRIDQLKIDDAIEQRTDQAGLQVSEQNLAQSVSNQTQVHASTQYQTVQIRTVYNKAVSALDNALNAEKIAQENHDLEIDASQAALNSSIAQAKYADAQLARSRSLLSKGYVAGSSVDQAQAQADQADAAVVGARKNLAVVVNNAGRDLKSSQEQVLQAKADLATARQVELQTAGQMAQQHGSDAAMKSMTAQLDQAHVALQRHASRLKNIEQAQYAVNGQAEQVQYILDQLAKGVIRSPIAGTVANLSVQQGETVAAGLQVQTLMTIVDLNRLQVKANIDETDVARVAPGQKVKITFDGMSDRTFPGRVVQVRTLPTTQNNVITYTAIISVDHPTRQLKPGMTASASIEVGRHSHVLLAPTDSIKTDGDNSVVGLYKAGSNSPVKTKVVTGAEDDSNTEIISGLHAGDRIAGSEWSPG